MERMKRPDENRIHKKSAARFDHEASGIGIGAERDNGKTNLETRDGSGTALCENLGSKESH